MNNKHVDDCDRSEFTLDQPITYQIKIAGHPNENWSDWVDQMDIQIETDPSGLATTILIGCFDQAALLGLLRCLYHVEYPLMSVNCVKAHPINSDLRIPENPLELEPIQIIQPQYNLLYREEEREMLPLCIDQNIAVAPWAPLGQGVLTGRYTREQLADSPRSGGEDLQHWFLREKDFEIIDRLVEVAQKKGTTPAQIALA